MSTDGQGRLLSDDGQWAWTGTQWVPAALSSGPSPAPTDANATTVTPSPFAAGGAPGAGQPGYGSASIANQPGQAYGAPAPGYGGAPAPGYGSAPAPGYGGPVPVYGRAPVYGSPVPGYGTAPPAGRSRKTVIIGITAVVVTVAVAVVLIVTLVGSKKSGPLGAFSCTAPGREGTGLITFKKGNIFTLGDDAAARTYVKSGNKLALHGGELNGTIATYDSDAKTITMTVGGSLLTCKPK
jgi:hypothetical protein